MKRVPEAREQAWEARGIMRQKPEEVEKEELNVENDEEKDVIQENVKVERETEVVKENVENEEKRERKKTYKYIIYSKFI